MKYVRIEHMKNELEKRVIDFSTNVIYTSKYFTNSLSNKTIIQQLIRSSTSTGANYFEANKSSSYKDFRNKIFICLKEINETKYWITLLNKTNPGKNQLIDKIYSECLELNKIFQSIANKLKLDK